MNTHKMNDGMHHGDWSVTVIGAMVSIISMINWEVVLGETEVFLKLTLLVITILYTAWKWAKEKREEKKHGNT